MAADEFSGLSLPPISGIPYAGENSGLIALASIRGSGAFFHGLGQCVALFCRAYWTGICGKTASRQTENQVLKYQFDHNAVGYGCRWLTLQVWKAEMRNPLR